MEAAVLIILAVVGLGLLIAPALLRPSEPRPPQPRQRTPQTRPYGGFKGFLLFSSGAKLDILRQCPTEENNYLMLGGAVVMTSTVAMFSSLLALSVALETGVAGALQYLPVGVAYGAIIYLIDRFLVSAQLNPYRFEEPPPLGGQPPPRARRRLGETLRTLLAALPRLGFALIIGLLIAEPVLLAIFHSEIDTEVASIRARLSEDALDRVEGKRQRQLQAIEPAPVDLNADGEPDIQTAQHEFKAVEVQIAAVERRMGELRLGLQEEVAGAVFDPDGPGPSPATTGRVGCADVCRQLETQIAQETAKLAPLRARQDELRATIDRLTQEAQAAAGPEHRAQAGKINAEAAAEADRTLADAQGAKGLLLRISALERLAKDDTPFADDEARSTTSDGASAPRETTGEAASEPPAASGQAARLAGVFGLGTLGTVIWVVRLWIVLLDTMPVIFKVVLSLRRRRPYDELVALEEERLHTQVLDRAHQLRQLRRSRLS